MNRTNNSETEVSIGDTPNVCASGGTSQEIMFFLAAKFFKAATLNNV